MIQINISEKFLPEKEYILSIIFGEFLGIPFNVRVHKNNYYEIIIENKNSIIFKDSFFDKLKDSNYLKIENLPWKSIFLKNQFIVENDIPVIFGTDELTVTNDKIICGIDIFASSFFMLTRWEEYVNLARDSHDRFPLENSYLFKNGIIERPVVNEYIEMLWNMLTHLKINHERLKKKFSVIPTHDVDHLLFSKRNLLKTIMADLIKRKSFLAAVRSFKDLLNGKINNNNDIFNTFDYLMDVSEKNSLKSYFFFMGTKKDKLNIGYSLTDNFIKKVISRINERGHFIGFHPGYYSYNNNKKWRNEYYYLISNIKHKVYYGRQHFLRFEIPGTWQIWEDNAMLWDSSLAFSDKAGFRCGICYEYSVFNILTRKKLNLKEKPLIVMEVSFSGNERKNFSSMTKKIIGLKNKVRKYNGEFVFLWHNSSFNTMDWQHAKSIYEEVLKG